VITVRTATEADAERLLAWANDPATRAAGFHPSPIDPGEHERWLTARLASGSGRLFIGLDGDRPVGQVRLEADDDGRVEVGISVAPEARGRGIGRALLEAGLAAGVSDASLRVAVFVARIRADNAASVAMFRGAGFHLARSEEWVGVPSLVYERPAG
jgi:UDP-2,4-diacetamido-2,4,6-trideoxy-beta-L-altropyranose hydrolase